MEINEYLNLSEDRTNVIFRVCEFNVQYKNNIVDMEQIDQLNKINADIMCLVECINGITEHLKNYIEINSSKSHCGFMKIFVHKRICGKNENIIINSKIDSQYILSIINTIFGKIIVGALHFRPRKNNSEIRKSALESINQYCKQYEYPCIIAGDTNMRYYEKCDTDFDDAWTQDKSRDYYSTWPNKKYDDKYSYIKAQDVNYDFRFDRIFLKKCSWDRFRTINTRNSDHIMTIVDVKKINYQEKDSPLIFNEKISKKLTDECKNKLNINDYEDKSIVNEKILKKHPHIKTTSRSKIMSLIENGRQEITTKPQLEKYKRGH